MASATRVEFVDRVRAALGPDDDRPDGLLLKGYVADRDEAAFAALVRRHGPLVYAACRRVVADPHAADDAFQATFLVLARKAATVAPREGLAGWLYAVAVHTALRARTMTDRRRKRESVVASVPEPRPADAPAETDPALLAALDEELARLPDKYRTPVVLCELRGESRRAVAGRLGIAEGTLSSRLAAARKVLADRLRKRGLALSVGAVAVALTDLGRAAAVPPSLSAAAATLGATTVVAPATVSALADGVLRAMFLHKLKLAAAVTAVVAVALLVASPLLRATPAADDPPKAAARPAQKPAAKPGRMLLFRSGVLTTIDPDGTNEVKVTEPRERMHPNSGWLSPDGTRVVYAIPKLPELPPGERTGRADPRLYVHTLGEKEPVDLGVSGQMVSWSADGSRVAVTDFVDGPDKASPEATHVVVDVKTKAKTALKVPADHLITDWSRDGKYFVTSAVGKADGKLRGRVHLMNADGTEHKALTDEKDVYFLGKLSPDGGRVLCTHVPQAKNLASFRALAVVDVKTGKVAPVGDIPENAELQGYCWSPDGKRIAFTWRQIHEGKPQEVQDKETESFLVVSDPDGKNQKVVASEKGKGQWSVTLGAVDWR